MPSWRLSLLGALLVGLAACAAYSPALDAQFVHWDDAVSVYANPHIRQFNWQSLHWMFTDIEFVRRYEPLMWVGTALIYQVAALEPEPYHLAGVILHAAGGILLLFVIRALLGRGSQPITEPARTVGATIGALLWVLHPMRVEGAAWVSARMYPQAFCFLMIAVLFYLRATGGTTPIWRRPAYWGAVLCSAAAMFTYPIAVSFVFVFPVLDVYPLRRLPSNLRRWLSPAALWIWLEKVPFVAAMAVVALLTLAARWAAAGIWSPPPTLEQFGLLPRIMQGFWVWAWYLWRPLVPVNLSPVYTDLATHFDPLSAAFILSMAAVVAMSALAIALRHRAPALLAVWVLHLLLLVPMLGLTEHPHFTSDRYCYIASAVWSVLIAAGLTTLWRRAPSPVLPRLAWAGAGVLVVTLGIMSYRQAKIWDNSVALFHHVLACLGDDPYQADIHWRLGQVYDEQGEEELAMRCFDATLTLSPNHPMARFCRANLLVGQGKLPEAVSDLRIALASEPEARMHRLLAQVLAQLGDLRLSQEHWQHALRMAPDVAHLHAGLGQVLIEQGRHEEGIHHMREAIRLDADLAAAHRNLGAALASRGDLGGAIGHFASAVRIHPTDADAHHQLGLALSMHGDVRGGLAHLHKAAELAPDRPQFLRRLAWTLAQAKDPQLRDPQRAVAVARHACRLTNQQDPAALDTLAVAYAAAGQFSDAASTARQALDLARRDGKQQLAEGIERRMEGYLTAAPAPQLQSPPRAR